jgi:phage terminase small subunit
MPKKRSAKAQGQGRSRKGARTRSRTGLTDKQEAFAHEYVRNGRNASDAYRTCYSVREGTKQATVNNAAWALLGHSGVAARIEKLSTASRSHMEATTERIILEAARVALFDPRKLYRMREDGTEELVPITELDDDTAAAIAGIEVQEVIAGGNLLGYLKKLKLSNKVASLSLLADIKGMKKQPEEKGKGGTLIMEIHTK